MKSIKRNQLYQLTITQWLEVIREPEVLFWGILFPVLLSIGMGLAFTQSSESKFRVMMVDETRTELDSLLDIYAQPNPKDATVSIWKVADNILGDSEFSFIRHDWKSAIVALKRGEADVIVTDSAGTLRYHFDPHNAQAQLVYMKLSELVKSPISGDAAGRDKADASIRPLTLQGTRYIDFLVPGLIAFGLMSSIMWGISYAIIERRSQKLLRRMVATPMKKSNLLIAMMFVRTLMNIIEAAILFLAVWLLFDIQIQGNIGALFTLFLAGNVAFTGVAVLISSRTSKTEVGTGWINAVQLPMMILSGIFFSYHNFPEWSIGAIKLLPLTALTDGIRSIFNEGAGWMEIVTPSIALSAFGVICFAAGLKWFKWY
ncbi:ABC-type multidrug transport system, permease component [Candidatus Symbiothrix dinenymphae]|nr:ABC-type multidrug transport system, permease component [Candidatus Symbiothrix dinenymphae]